MTQSSLPIIIELEHVQMKLHMALLVWSIGVANKNAICIAIKAGIKHLETIGRQLFFTVLNTFTTFTNQSSRSGNFCGHRL